MNKLTCRICGNQENNDQIYHVREMLFGTNKSFDYFECGRCHCLQIVEIPENIAEFYPETYSAYNKHKGIKKLNAISQFLKYKKSQYCLGRNKNLIGGAMTYFFGGGFVEKLAPANVDFNDEILDVGTGTGGRILDLKRRGFKNLSGSDIFIPGDIFYDNGVKIFKKDVSEIHETYDFIMLNHSLEHMPDPLRILKELYRLLKNGKYVLIRIPVSDSYSWKHYRENWVDLDAPRHFFLHTRKSMEILAKQAGFNVSDVVYDSTEYQFAGSEQYLKDIPAYAENSYFINPEKSIFSKKDIKRFKKKAKKLNDNEEGDTACFYLYKP